MLRRNCSTLVVVSERVRQGMLNGYCVYLRLLARDTEHERAVRGASLGAAFVVYRKEEEADPILDQMAKDKVLS